MTSQGNENVFHLCTICKAVSGKYVCPRCNIFYCSVTCYQSENHVQCSETFYRENVLEHLNSQEINPEDNQRILNMLERTYLQEQEDGELLDSDDDDDNQDLVERLAGINLDDANAVWENLTPSEQQAFEELVQNGNVDAIVPKWEPWWNYRNGKTLVEEVGAVKEADEPDYRNYCPALKNVPCLTQISKCAPAPCVKWNVMNVVSAYCYMMRYFNGEPHEYASEAVAVLATLSANLLRNCNYDSFEMATESVAQEAINCPWLDGCEERLSTMRSDVLELLHGPEESNPSYYLQAALSDVHHLLEQAAHSRDTGAVSYEESKFYKRFGHQGASKAVSIPKKTIRLYIKKLEYFMSWAKSYMSSR